MAWVTFVRSGPFDGPGSHLLTCANANATRGFDEVFAAA
ncbi:Uncharacterised protein [Nocardia cyriacigeorgica]|uniref:Uncharacterized protein n=1 Tax=Nocardia cyriacigeorgica TaxID=135487 RepID=A0A4U8VZ52_9NOCA|nr:Uncharacterised protein [Nocardia cyriacigeorgica]